MKLLTLAAAISLALAAGCDRNQPLTPPSPKTDTVSPAPSQAGAGSTTTPANAGNPTSADRKDGANPVQGQVDPKSAAQHRDFQQRGDAAGPRSSDTTPTQK